MGAVVERTMRFTQIQLTTDASQSLTTTLTEGRDLWRIVEGKTSQMLGCDPPIFIEKPVASEIIL
jgi:hypothetical protein